jgi:catechol 2,3-dioxygenase-like lactoylglutathione lyase family enzyme
MSASSPLITGTDFVLLPTRDFEAASAFYGDVLGLPCSARYGQAPGAEFETGSLTLQVLQVEALGMEFHPARNPVVMHVDDVAAARELLESKGVRFVTDTIDSGVCHMAFFNDPDGNALGIHHRYAQKD